MLTCSTTTCQISPAYPKFIEKLRRMIWGREPSTSYEFDELAQQVALKSHRRNVDDGYYVEEIHFEPPQVVRKKQPTRNLFYKRSHKKLVVDGVFFWASDTVKAYQIWQKACWMATINWDNCDFVENLKILKDFPLKSSQISIKSVGNVSKAWICSVVLVKN